MNGYSIRLALGHLVVGPFRPRQVARETSAIGLAEKQRLAIIVVEVWLMMLVNSKTRDLIWAKVTMLQSVYAPLFLVFVLACLSIYAGMTYFAGAAIATGMLKAFGVSEASFVLMRSATAVATWITLILEIAYSVVVEAAYPDASDTARWYDPANIVWSGLSIVYFTICISQFSKSTLVQAFVTALMADFGVHILTDILFNHIDEHLATL